MKCFCVFSLYVFTLFYFNTISSQSVFPPNGILFNDEVVPRIDVLINEDSLESLLTFENLEKNHEYPAQFIWNDGAFKDTLSNVGFRLRGNTSRFSQKKSFKIKFDRFDNQNFEGVKELNLNGEHNDPSISRAKIGWDMMKKAGIECPRSNHVRLYINGEYRGLYLNVEHIDNEYLKARKKSVTGQIFKCNYGVDFVYRGPNPDEYSDEVYEPANNKANVNLERLIEFTRTLNKVNNEESRCDLEKIFDVDRYLKTMAFEILIGHWDNPLYNINNAYLYFNDATGKLEILSYDIDNTFGIDWFNVDWSQRNIYNWAKSNSDRPIYYNLMKVPEYRKRFGYYINQFISEIYNVPNMQQHSQTIKNRIMSFVVNDYYFTLDYGFNYSDFLNAFDHAFGLHVKFGIMTFVAERVQSAKLQLENLNIAPFIEYESITKDTTKLTIELKAKGNSSLMFIFNHQFENGNWNSSALRDDGIFPDSIANDSIFTVALTYENNKTLNYFIELKDLANNSSRIPYCDFNLYLISYNSAVKLYINEFMADNSTLKDDAGEFEDWIEIYNDSDEEVYLKDYYLTDDANNPTKWKMPDFVISGKSFLTFWADEDTSQDLDHCNFKLSKEGEFIGLFEGIQTHFAPIDTFSYGPVLENRSYGKYPDGEGKVSLLDHVTFGQSNIVNAVEDVYTDAFLFPNPSNGEVQFNSNIDIKRIEIYSSGSTLKEVIHTPRNDSKIDLTNLLPGLYIIRLVGTQKSFTTKLLIVH